MISILESGAHSALNTDKPGATAGGATDTDSGGVFGQILSTQGQPAQAQAGDQAPTGRGEDGGNALHPGGNSLPSEPAASDAADSILPLDLTALTSSADDALPVDAHGSSTPTSQAPVLTAVTGVALTDAAQALQARDSAGLPAVPGQSAPRLAASPALPQAVEDSAVAGTPRPATAPPTVTAGQSAQPVTLQALTATDPTAGQVPVVLGPDAAQVAVDPGTARAPVDALARPAVAVERVQAAESTAFSARMMDVVAEELPVARAVSESTTLLSGAESSRAVAPPAPAQAQGLTGAPLPPLLDSTAAPATKVNGGVALTTVTGDPGWNNEVAARVTMMFRNGTSEAKVQLNPPELGRMDIKISSEGDHTRVHFAVQGADTRDVIEQALPRLREMLAESGLTLSSFDVADQSDAHHSGGGEVESQAFFAETEDTSVVTELAPAQASGDNRALVDYYV